MGRVVDDLDDDAGGGGGPLHAVDGVVEQDADRDRLATRRLLGLDEAQVEQVVDDLAQSLGLLHHELGHVTGHERVGLRREGLGEDLERADGRLELVADVGDEVAANAIDPMDLRHVVHEHRRADRLVVVPQRDRLDLQHRSRRPEELQLALGGTTGSRLLEQVGDRSRRHRVDETRVAVPLGGLVAEDLVAVGVDDHQAVPEIGEGGGEAVALDAGSVGRGLLVLAPLGLAAQRAQPNLPVM